MFNVFTECLYFMNFAYITGLDQFLPSTYTCTSSCHFDETSQFNMQKLSGGENKYLGKIGLRPVVHCTCILNF